MRHSLALLLCLFVLIMPACAMGDETMLPTPWQPFNEGFYNPFLSTANDPWIVKGEDGAYYYCFSYGGLHVVRSETLTGMMAAELNSSCVRILEVGKDQTEIWAPELHFYQGHWYCFYAADYNNDNTLHRMYVMRSETDDALGKWGEPVKLELPEDQWAIDGTFFEYADGRIFFIWSGWKNQAQGTSLWKQYLYIAQLETGDPTRVVSTDRVMVSKPEYIWEISSLPQNEGPSVIVSPEGTYYCMYSGNFSGSDEYTVAAVRLNGDPLDETAWEKLPEPVLASDPELRIFSPGHASFVKSPDGTEDWIIFHTAKTSGSGWTRNGRAQRLAWVNDTPVVEGIVPNDEQIALPAGEQTNRILFQLEDGVLSEGAVLRQDMTTSPVVEMTTGQASITLYVEAARKTTCALYIRHNGARSDKEGIVLRMNGGSGSRIAATISGGEDQFVVDCMLLGLKEGVNTLNLRASEGMVLDLAVLDLAPFGQ